MKIKLLIIISLLIGICTIFCLKMNNNNKFNLDSIYYERDKFIAIDSSELDNLLNNKKSFILYPYNNYCTFKVSCDEIFINSIKELNITILKIPFDEFKNNILYNEIKYAPSIILIKEGKIITYLDPNKDENLSKYQDSKQFTSWIKEYINI